MIQIEREEILKKIAEHRQAQRQYFDLAIANDGAAHVLEELLKEYDDQEAIDLDKLGLNLDESATDEAQE